MSILSMKLSTSVLGYYSNFHDVKTADVYNQQEFPHCDITAKFPVRIYNMHFVS